MNLPRITQHPLCCNSHANWKNLRRSWIFGKCDYANFSQSANFAYRTSADFAECQKAVAPVRDVSETTANSDKPLNLLPIRVSAIDHPPIDVQVI